jgi:outer membrane lipoprotein-sorting protein
MTQTMDDQHNQFSRRSLIALMGATLAQTGLSHTSLAQSVTNEDLPIDALPADALGTDILPTEIDLAPVRKVDSYLNGLVSLKGRFTQLAPSGQLDSGMFYLRRPGRMRFEYDDPNPLVIVSDGTWIMLNDRALETVDRYPLRSTPLKFLLKKDIDLGKDAEILEVTKIPPDGIVITAQDDKKKNKAEAQGQISLYFGQYPVELRQWQITDAQGYQTTVTFQNLERDLHLEASLFTVKEDVNPFKRRNR